MKLHMARWVDRSFVFETLVVGITVEFQGLKKVYIKCRTRKDAMGSTPAKAVLEALSDRAQALFATCKWCVSRKKPLNLRLVVRIRCK